MTTLNIQWRTQAYARYPFPASLRRTLWLVLAVCCLSACEDGNAWGDGWTASRNGNYLIPSGTVATLPPTGGSRRYSLDTNLDVEVSTDASWLTAVKSGAADIVVTAAANTTTSDRTATVILIGGGLTATISVTQACYGPDPLGLCPDNNHPHAIDMGTGVKFACCNVGASTPADYGDYFAWGETSPKSTYYWSTYKWCNGSEDTMTKYCTSSSYGTVDNLTQLELSDDAARAVMGGTWRMPTIAELSALNSNCTWTWTSKGGHNGYLVTASNGNKLFLPAAGYRYETSLGGEGSLGRYWSSTLSTSNSSRGLSLSFDSSSHFTSDYGYRYYGLSVRAVTK